MESSTDQSKSIKNKERAWLWLPLLSYNHHSIYPVLQWSIHIVIWKQSCQLQLISRCQSAAGPANEAFQSIPLPPANLHCWFIHLYRYSKNSNRCFHSQIIFKAPPSKNDLRWCSQTGWISLDRLVSLFTHQAAAKSTQLDLFANKLVPVCRPWIALLFFLKINNSNNSLIRFPSQPTSSYFKSILSLLKLMKCVFKLVNTERRQTTNKMMMSDTQAARIIMSRDTGQLEVGVLYKQYTIKLNKTSLLPLTITIKQKEENNI